MALKLFCAFCEKYIKDLNKNDIGEVTGHELCEDCRDQVQDVYKQIRDVSNKSIMQIQRKRDQTLEQIETLLRDSKS